MMTFDTWLFNPDYVARVRAHPNGKTVVELDNGGQVVSDKSVEEVCRLLGLTQETLG